MKAMPVSNKITGIDLGLTDRSSLQAMNHPDEWPLIPILPSKHELRSHSESS